MDSSLSILNSEKLGSLSFWRFLARLGLFLTAPAVVCLLVVFLAVRSGELLPVGLADWAQRTWPSVIYLPKLSDHNYRFKLEATLSRRPDVLALGSSRMNQWRSAMFRPLSFYNAGNSAYTTEDIARFVTDLGAYSPKVLIFPVDFFMFDPKFAESYGYVQHGDVVSSSNQAATILWSVLEEMRSKPSLLVRPWKDPLYGVPALGLQAIETGIGFRQDGSLQYGKYILGNNDDRLTINGMLQRVASGAAPVQFADHIDPKLKEAFKAFVAVAKAKGITLIGVTMPMEPPVVRALDASPRHGIWREFRTSEFRDWITSLGVNYIDFMDISSFDGRSDEFVDPFHASEPSYIRMLTKMLQMPRVAAALPGIDQKILDRALEGATPLEAFRNEF